jgi:radical SAM superfamily enzyme YgiQ (UPF0313 family)
LIGLESPWKSSLENLEMNANWKIKRHDGYKAAIQKIQSYGITVNGCFVLGLDGDTPDVFEEVYNFVRESGLYEVQVTLMTAFPGTPLYARLKAENRIIQDEAWNLCTLFDINIIPNGMTVDELKSGFYSLVEALYNERETNERRHQFHRMLRTSPNFRQGSRLGMASV